VDARAKVYKTDLLTSPSRMRSLMRSSFVEPDNTVAGPGLAVLVLYPPVDVEPVLTFTDPSTREEQATFGPVDRHLARLPQWRDTPSWTLRSGPTRLVSSYCLY
jgi:hypothetical protein